MAIVKVQSPTPADSVFTGQSTQNVTFASALTSGSKLLAFGSTAVDVSASLTGGSCTDTAGNTWTLVFTRYWANVGYTIALWWCDNTSTQASDQVTVNFGSSASFVTLHVAEFTGLATGAHDVASAGANQSASTTVTDASMTTTVDGDLIVSVVGSDGGVLTAGAGNTLIDTASGSAAAWEYRIQTTAGAIANTMTQGSAVQALIRSAAFKPDAGAAATPSPRQSNYFAPRRNPALQRVRWRPVLQGVVTDSAVIAFDTGTGAESASVAAALTGSDTGSGADSATLAAAVPVADTGSGANAATLAAALTGTDTATGTDAGTLASSGSGADTGAGADAASVAATLTAADTAAAVDSAFVDTGTPISGTDTASGANNATVAASTTTADTGSGASSASVTASRTVSDTATAADSASVMVLITTTDNATAADLAALAANVSAADLASAVDTASIFDPGAALYDLYATADPPQFAAKPDRPQFKATVGAQQFTSRP